MRLLLLTLTISILTSVYVYSQPPVLPSMMVKTGRDSMQSLSISKLDISISVTGNIAQTNFDITFYNRHNRVLEGEFVFPLAEGQSVHAYALEINGKLREAVAVEKQKGRVAYESTVRQEIDPGLVEKTKGNNYRTRVYPIPAKGYKRVVIGIEQALQYSNTELLFQLPVQPEKAVKNISVRATVYNSAEPVVKETAPRGFVFTNTANDWTAVYKQTSVSTPLDIAFSIPVPNEAGIMSFTGMHKGQNYFYLSMPYHAEYVEKMLPHFVTVFWDISSSGAGRKKEREIELLKAYAAKLNNATITLIPFNNTQHPAETFRINGGNSDELVERIRRFTYDGGTQLGVLKTAAYSTSQVLLFTDGISTIGKKELDPGPGIPYAVINSSDVADHAALNYIAKKTNGLYLNLNSIDDTEALNSLVYTPVQYIGAEYKSNEITELYATGATSRNGFAISGKLHTATAAIKLNFGYGNTVVASTVYTISTDDDAIRSVPKTWAALKINELEMQYEKNKTKITEMGKEFSIVTQNTSLIVLDRVEDYVAHDIVPPAELKARYDVLMKTKQATAARTKEQMLKQSLAVMEEMKKWYLKKYKKVVQPVIIADTAAYLTDTVRFSPGIAAAPNANLSLMADFSPTVADSSLGNVTYGFTTNSRASNGGGQRLLSGSATYMSPGHPVYYATYDPYDHDLANNRKPLDAAIKMNIWNSNAEYMKQLESLTSSSLVFAEYLTLKDSFKDHPTFYVDVATLLNRHNDRQLALQVLSNIAEIKLDDPELLRILGHQLKQWDEKELAVETFRELVALQGEHPQSYRDLAMVLMEWGNYQEAAELLYKAMTEPMDDRFAPMRSVVISEFNGLLSAHKEAINTSSMDKRLIFPMPVDVRIVISWTSDNSDIDLWVTDPLREKCMYSFALTKGGGRLSGDITAGFGPEEYLMRDAVAGEYIIEINYYGDTRQTMQTPVTVTAELFTHYGTAQQKKQAINLRLSEKKEVIKLGVLEFNK